MVIDRNNNSTAILALTTGGVSLAGRLAGLLGDAKLFVPSRLAGLSLPPGTVFFNNWQETAATAFRQYQSLIFIMATGIVVRTLAPLLDSKKTDPAVVVLDERGQFVISLLSGHVGGANLLANSVAQLIGGTAVITTATDVNKVPALDLLAKELACDIYPAKAVKLFNRLMAEGERVALCSPWSISKVAAGFNYTGNIPPATGPVVYITNKLVQYRQGSRLILRPRNLIVGVGCRKGVSREQVISAIKTAFKLGGFSLLAMRALTTVDLKMAEPGLQQAAAYFSVPLVEVTRQQINALNGQYVPSDFVKDTIGVGGVCEPTALITSKQGQLKVPKQKLGPVTVAIAEARLWWWD